MPSVTSSSHVTKVKHEAIRLRQRSLTFYLLKMHASEIVDISYVAARGASDEAGAVQRILNPRRISSIREYTLKVGSYPSSIILNWVNTKYDVSLDKGHIVIPLVERSAQIIDGQHRVAGIRAAIDDNADIGELEIPVALYKHLGTKECADIFLSINTEQKPVQKSLVYDLYGLASEYIVDFEASRAKDIATTLNEQDDSPYFGFIKFPGPARKRGGIALSTVVSAIKPLVAEKGVFEQAGLIGLDTQTKAIVNYFHALCEMYGDEWDNKDNAFIYAAGFAGAIDFLKNRLLDYCVRHRSFTPTMIRKVLTLNESELIHQSELKGLGGTQARQRVADRLLNAFDPGEDSDEADFKF
jgi:DGQHR domain-containing protein